MQLFNQWQNISSDKTDTVRTDPTFAAEREYPLQGQTTFSLNCCWLIYQRSSENSYSEYV